ncbi:hypothetical protein ZHAS_00005161 [Anopheles sinensis]|uniref:Uncharacterized protein n=1 Tax=Anopheles sinensis TaxID=74873 RepID=A0A084VJ42_ANOSI|nr:hypothetical protein ZHAS_00005161 [Anopheles sinensis]
MLGCAPWPCVGVTDDKFCTTISPRPPRLLLLHQEMVAHFVVCNSRYQQQPPTMQEVGETRFLTMLCEGDAKCFALCRGKPNDRFEFRKPPSPAVTWTMGYGVNWCMCVQPQNRSQFCLSTANPHPPFPLFPRAQRIAIVENESARNKSNQQRITKNLFFLYK